MPRPLLAALLVALAAPAALPAASAHDETMLYCEPGSIDPSGCEWCGGWEVSPGHRHCVDRTGDPYCVVQVVVCVSTGEGGSGG